MSWQLFDRLAAFFRDKTIYRQESLFQDQYQLDKLTVGGDFLNFGTQSALLEQTNLQINRLERYKDFDQMDEVGVITLALDLYAEEASLIDPELKHAMTIKAKNKRVKEELEDLFFDTLMIDNILRGMIRYLCKYGDFAAEIVPTKNRTGVANIKFMNVYNFTRVETKFGDLVGFFFQDQLSSSPSFLHPWQVMHLRLTSYENIYHPYGRSILDGARKHFKQLRLMEDAALIYRITRAPEKRVFTIPVGNIPTAEVEQYIQNIARQFKKRQFFDPSTGDVNERWHPLIQEDDFWLPQRADGSGPTITTLPGAENLDDIKDIEYFKKNMVSGLKIPFERVGLGESTAGNERSLSQVSPEFAKSIQWIQREVAIGLKKIAIVHLALNGYSAEDIRNFDIHMTASSAIDELYRIEVWQSRANVIDALRATEMFPKRWILERFTDMTEDELDELDEEMKKMQAQQMQSMGGGMGGPEGGMGGGMPGPGGPGGFPEGYDIELEKELLLEMNRSAQMIDEEITEEKVIHDYGLFTPYKTGVRLISGFDHMMENCELDGLSSQEIEDPYKADLIKPVLNEDLRKSAIDRTKMLLVEGLEPKLELEPEEITENDLPSRMVFVN